MNNFLSNNMRIRNRDSRELAKELAEKFNLQKSEHYDLVGGRSDGLYELIGLYKDPNYDIADFEGREMLFPLRWITAAVIDPRNLQPV